MSSGVAMPFAIELVGLVLLAISSSVTPPFTTTVSGPAEEVNWACCPYETDVGGQQFFFDGPPTPLGPGPHNNESIELTYLDLVQGWRVLSITTDPGQPSSITYNTPDRDRYLRNLPLSYAALVGLPAGLILIVAGLVAFYRLGRRRGAPYGALCLGFGLLSSVGYVAPILAFAKLPAGGAALLWTALLGLLAVGLAVTFFFVSRSKKEQPRSFANSGIVVTGVLFGVIAVGLVASIATGLATYY
jgi:hypothetical protein